MRRGPLHLPLLLLVILLGACATRVEDTGVPGTGTPTPLTSSASAGPLPGPVTVVRTGGIAGVRDTVVVQPDGSWRRTATTGRGAGGTGRLAAADLAELRALAADPRLAVEAGRTAVPVECADAFVYSVQVGGTTVPYVDCAQADPPATATSIVALVLSATGP